MSPTQKSTMGLVAVVALMVIVSCLYLYLTNGHETNTVDTASWAASKVGMAHILAGNSQVPLTSALISPVSDPIPTYADLKKISLRDLNDFFDGYIHSVQILCSRRIRMGSLGDGGWDLCEDPQHIPNHKDCLVYSFGIAHDWTYDVALQRFGCEVHSYDPSLGLLNPSEGEKFVFHKIGIGKTNRTSSQNWAIHTLGKARELNGHAPPQRRLDVVKMDVEGAEMGALQEALKEGSLMDVRQLAFEIHIRRAGRAPRKDYLLSILQLLRGLWQTGFRLYFTNRNISPNNKYHSHFDGKEYTLCYELHMIRTQS